LPEIGNSAGLEGCGPGRVEMRAVVLRGSGAGKGLRRSRLRMTVMVWRSHPKSSLSEKQNA